MTDQQPDEGLTPDQTQAVRALLRSVRVQDPIPPEVAARLEATLESLEAERNPGATRGGGHLRSDGVFVDPDPTTIRDLPEPPTPTAERPRAAADQPPQPNPSQHSLSQQPPLGGSWPTPQPAPQPASAYPVAGGPLPQQPSQQSPAPVVDLAARRRRRAGIGLLAAAAAVVAAVGVGQLVGNDDPTNDAGSETTPSEAPSEPQGDDSAAPSSPVIPSQEPLPSVGTSTFRADVERAWPLLAQMEPEGAEDLLLGCARPAGTDYAYPVTTPGSTAVHALYADQVGPGEFEVTLYDCSASEELTSARLRLSEEPE